MLLCASKKFPSTSQRNTKHRYKVKEAIRGLKFFKLDSLDILILSALPFVNSRSILFLAISQYSSLLSTRIQFLSSSKAANPVVPLPAKGSKISPPGGDKSFIKNWGNVIGKTAGCPIFLPTSGRLKTLEGKTLFLPTHRDISLPNPLALDELCLFRSLSPNFANLADVQDPIGFLMSLELK